MVTVAELTHAMPALLEFAEQHQLPDPIAIYLRNRDDGAPVVHVALGDARAGRAWNRALDVAPARRPNRYYTHVRGEGLIDDTWIVTHHTEA